MSTRSNIAIEDPKTKKVKVIYVHSDGYPYGVGQCLVDHYNRRELAELLFEHGDASYLGDTIRGLMTTKNQKRTAFTQGTNES